MLCLNETSLVAQAVKHLPTMWETLVLSLGWEDPLEKEMATHSSILAWKIPWTEEPARLQSRGCKELDMTERLHFTLLNCVRLFVTPWTVAYHTPLSMGFSRQEYWSGLPFPSPKDLSNPGIEPGSPAL